MRTSQTVEAIQATVDPSARLAAIREAIREADGFGDELRRIRREAVHELRSSGSTWAEIGQLLGVSPQRAAKLAA